MTAILDDLNKVAFNIVAKDDGIMEIENCTPSKVDYQKVHNKTVSGVGHIDKNKLVTCSQDGKIKAWRMEIKESLQFGQIGEFTGHGPAFSAMEVVGKKLVAGDTAGNVFCLEMK